MLKNWMVGAALALLLIGPSRVMADPVGAVMPGTRATQSELAGCTYNSAGVTLANGQQAAVQCGSDGTLKISGTVSPSGTQSVNIAQVAGVTVPTGNGTAATAMRVTLPTDGTGVVGLNAGSNLIGNVGVGQATATAGQSGPIVQGAVTTSSPTYSTGQTSPLSLDTTGALRVVTTGSSANPAAGPTASPVPAAADYQGLNVGGNLVGNTGVTIGGATLADVNLGSVAGTATAVGHGVAATALRVELPTDGTGVVGLNAGSNTIGKVDINAGSAIIGNVRIDQTTPGTTNGVQVNAALPAGSNIIGRVGIDQTTPGTTNLVSAAQSGTWTVQPGNTPNTSAWLVQNVVGAAGGTSTFSAVGGTGTALLTNSAVAVDASPGNLYGVNFYNPNSSVVYVQFFNVAAGSVTLGTTVPKLSYPIPPNGWMDTNFAGAQITFSTAITVAATTTATGNGAPSTGVTANILYK